MCTIASQHRTVYPSPGGRQRNFSAPFVYFFPFEIVLVPSYQYFFNDEIRFVPSFHFSTLMTNVLKITENT